MEAEQYLCTWLHLSDIHFGQRDPAERARRLISLETLRADILRCIDDPSQGPGVPQAMLVTGDLAASGGVAPAEYNHAGNWLGDLARVLEISTEMIATVPGNHDVRRTTSTHIDRDPLRLIEDLRKGNNDMDEALADSWDRGLLTKRLEEYLEFSRRFGHVSSDLGCWVYRPEAWESLGVVLVGLNTALLCNDNRDRSKLRLGSEQLGQLVKLDKQRELVIVLTHHPRDWLRDSDSGHLMDVLRTHAHVHLLGHMHEHSSYTLVDGGGRHLVEVTSGPSHVPASKKSAGYRPHAYSFCALFKGADNEIIMRVWPRRQTAEFTSSFIPEYAKTLPNKPYADHHTGFFLPKDREPAAPPSFRPSRLLSQSYSNISLCVVACEKSPASEKKEAGDGAVSPSNRTSLSRLHDLLSGHFVMLPDGAYESSELGIRLQKPFSLNCSSSSDDVKRVLEERVSGFVVQLGPDPVCPNCQNLLTEVIKKHAQEFRAEVVLLRLGEVDTPAGFLDGTFPVSYVPSLVRTKLPDYRTDQDALTALREEFSQRLRAIADSRPRDPTVAIGVLLLNEQGRFLLTRRTREPGKELYGTFGGELRKDMSIRDELYEIGMRELDLKKDELSIGSLICLTEMPWSTKHYVDLTFAAVVKGNSAPRINDLRHAPISYNGNEPKLWFSFQEVMDYYRRAKLFQPVANAFARFATLCVFNHVSKGPLNSMDLKPSAEIVSDLDLPDLPRITELPTLNELATFLGHVRSF